MSLQQLFLTKRCVMTGPLCNRREQTVCDLYVHEELGGGIWNYVSLFSSVFHISVYATDLSVRFSRIQIC
jgi:hypothetical protein